MKSFESLRKIPTEYEEQVELFEWIEKNKDAYKELEFIFATLNGVRLPMGLAMKSKRMGMKAGVPDIIFPIPRGHYHGLFIEMKRTKGGVVSPDQIKWQTFLVNNNYYHQVCRGARQAVEIIMTYLLLK